MADTSLTPTVLPPAQESWRALLLSAGQTPGTIGLRTGKNHNTTVVFYDLSGKDIDLAQSPTAFAPDEALRGGFDECISRLQEIANVRFFDIHALSEPESKEDRDYLAAEGIEIPAKADVSLRYEIIDAAGSYGYGILRINPIHFKQKNTMNRFGFATVFHEMGHMMGLKHPHETSPDNDFALPMNDPHNHTNYSVESYRGFSDYSYYRINDVKALQHIYGKKLGEYEYEKQYPLDFMNYLSWENNVLTLHADKIRGTTIEDFDLGGNSIRFSDGRQVNISGAYDMSVTTAMVIDGTDRVTLYERPMFAHSLAPGNRNDGKIHLVRVSANTPFVLPQLEAALETGDAAAIHRIIHAPLDTNDKKLMLDILRLAIKHQSHRELAQFAFKNGALEACSADIPKAMLPFFAKETKIDLAFSHEMIRMLDITPKACLDMAIRNASPAHMEIAMNEIRTSDIPQGEKLSMLALAKDEIKQSPHPASRALMKSINTCMSALLTSATPTALPTATPEAGIVPTSGLPSILQGQKQLE